MMDPETRRFLRQNLHLIHDADLRAEVQDLPDGDAESRSASRALGWWVVALLIVASVAVGMVVGHFVIKVLANAAVTVVQAEQFQGEW